MAQLTKHTVDHIRTLYSSGLYHKSDLVIRFIAYLETPMDLIKILDYNVFPEVRKDLWLPIIGIGYVFDASRIYHKALQVSAELEHENVQRLKDKSPANFFHDSLSAKSILAEKLVIINKEFKTDFSVYDIQSRLYRDV